MQQSEVTVYGSKHSYYTGKLEAYLRYKEIPYRFQPMTMEYFNRIVPEKTGAQQMPAVEFPDGRWATDSTPLIHWFETEHPDYPIIPENPELAFVAMLIEDYADEWLWRPAMHYRWSHFADRQLLGIQLTEELMADLPAPAFIKHWQIRRRQKGHFVDRDGVTPQTRANVEQGYLRCLDILQAIFEQRPYILGEHPTLADFGLYGPMFRHFSQDPTPAEIMRLRAPAVFEWVGRLWNARASGTHGDLVDTLPADILPLLTEIGATHLTHLAGNAEAWRDGKKHFNVGIQGTQYVNLPASRYRVWCLEQLQAAFDELPDPARESVQRVLAARNCWRPLWQVRDSSSDYNRDGSAPFAAGLKVYPVGEV